MHKDRIRDVSVSSVLYTRKPNKDGLYAVRIQLTYKRVQRYINTGSWVNIAYISEFPGYSDTKTSESYLASFEKNERIKNASLLTNFK